MGAILFFQRDCFGWLRQPDNDRGGSNSLDGEVGNNGLTQGDATIVTGYLPVGKNLETAAFQ